MDKKTVVGIYIDSTLYVEFTIDPPNNVFDVKMIGNDPTGEEPPRQRSGHVEWD